MYPKAGFFFFILYPHYFAIGLHLLAALGHQTHLKGAYVLQKKNICPKLSIPCHVILELSPQIVTESFLSQMFVKIKESKTDDVFYRILDL